MPGDARALSRLADARLLPPSLVRSLVALGHSQIYGLVVSVLISGDLQSPMALYTGFIQLGAGLSVGLAGLAAGFAVGIVGDAGVRGVAQQSRVFVGMVLILIFAEVLGLYGLIVALILNTKSSLHPPVSPTTSFRHASVVPFERQRMLTELDLFAVLNAPTARVERGCPCGAS